MTACTTLSWPGHQTDAYGWVRCPVWRPDMFSARPGVARWCEVCRCWTLGPAVLTGCVTVSDASNWGFGESRSHRYVEVTPQDLAGREYVASRATGEVGPWPSEPE